MGTVWRARDRQLHRTVAVKSPHPLAPDDPRCDRLMREARLAASVSHPNLVDVYDVGEDDEGPYLVMQFVDAPSLAEVGRSLDPERIVAIGADLAQALATLHQAGIVHRDVKPANVLLPPGGAKLVDFGVALDIDGRNGFEPTASGVVLGTRGYLAPEVARGEPASPRSDVYGLAKVLTGFLGAGTPVDPVVAAALAGATAERPDERPDAAHLAIALGAADDLVHWPPPGTALSASTSTQDRPTWPADDPTMAAPPGVLPTTSATAANQLAPPEGSGSGRGGVGPSKAVAGGVLVVVSTVVVTLVVAAWASSRDDADGPAVAPSTITATTAVTLPATTATTTTTTTAPPSSSVDTTNPDPLAPFVGDRDEAEAAVLDVLGGLVGDGEDDRDATERIAEKTVEAGRALADGKEGKAEDRLRDAAKIAARDLDGSTRRQVLVQLQVWADEFGLELLPDGGRRGDD
jgi:eukaryotic-like serine/threonine-protein kinase